MRARRGFVVCCVSALALAAAGCGSNEKAIGRSPDVWWLDICTALTRFEDGTYANKRMLEQHVRNSKSVVEARSAVIHYIDFAIRKTNALLADIRRAGQPAVENGDQLTRAFQQAFIPFRRALIQSRAQAQRLPADPERFFEGLQEIQQRLLTSAREISRRGKAANDKYATDELEKAYDNEVACDFP